jgi:hypothetical protein
MPRISKLLVIPFLAAFQFGCDPYPEYSDLEQWKLDVSLPNDIPGVDRPSHVLVGSRIFVELLGQRDDEGAYVRIGGDLRSCVHVFGNGTVEWVDDPEDESGAHGLVVAEGPGSIVISAPREACPEYLGPGEDFVRDTWSVLGVELMDTTASWRGGFDSYALTLRSSGPIDYPDALGQIHLGPALVAEGGSFQVGPLLTRVVDGETVEVRHSRPGGELLLPEAYQSWLVEPYIWSLDAGEQVDARLAYGDEEIALPTLEGVPVDRIASLELVPIYELDTSGKREWGLPSGVIALAHDAEGRRIFGAPIEWSVSQGRVAIQPFAEASDVLSVGDSCRDSPITKDSRDATIEARVAGLVASAEFEWTALRDDDIEIDTESPLCQGSACDCSASATPNDSLAALFGLLVLGLGLRRGRIARPNVGRCAGLARFRARTAFSEKNPPCGIHASSPTFR